MPAGLDRAADWAWRLLLCVAAIVVVVVILWYVRVIVLPAMVALTLAPALTPLTAWLRQVRLERPAAGLALLAGLAVVAGLIAIVTISVLAQFDELRAAVAEAVIELVGRLRDEPFDLSFESTQDLEGSLGDAWRDISSYLAQGVRASIGLITGLVLAVTLLYFVLRDGARFWSLILGRFGPENREAVDRAGQRAWAVLGGYVRGTAMIAAIDATLIGIGLWILDVPLAFALAVLVFLGAFIPFVGAFISGLVAVLVAFADGGWTLALIVLALVVAVQVIEGTFLQPIIQSRTVDLHPAVILLAVAAGGSLFGIIGAYLAVPVTAVVLTVLASLDAERRGSPLPEES